LKAQKSGFAQGMMQQLTQIIQQPRHLASNISKAFQNTPFLKKLESDHCIVKK